MPFAHSNNGSGKRHDLVDHLRSVAQTASNFALPLGADRLAFYAGLWHDLGKFHPQFDAYLTRCETGHPGRKVDHKGAGAELALQQGLPFVSLLIQGHHGGLRSPTDFNGWLQEKRAGPAIEEALALAAAAMPDLKPQGEVPLPPRDRLAAEMFLRLVFSALVDADFLDTEAHFAAKKSLVRGTDVSIEQLWQRFSAAQEHRVANAPPSVVNGVRRTVYEHCLQAAEGEQGFYRLTVPTGGGKTLSGMAFALRHALRHGLQRVVVAVPFISITEQTAGVYREVFGAADERAVLEHHSMAEWDDDGDGDFTPDAHWDRLAAENWDAPVIVTTTVQLFESLFSNRTSRTRKLHRLARSVIILDEAQALPAKLLKPILDGLKQLVERYGVTVVFSTATQPAFDVIPMFAEVAATEIVPEPARLFDALRRVEYEWRTETPMSPVEAATLLGEHAQSLAILNTKQDALELLSALDAASRPTATMADSWDVAFPAALREAGALHLSTLLCGAHRRDLLAEIKRRLGAGEACKLVSTQVIEAGVDLDFPFVMRAMGPLDSIIQAAGRCNREGKLPGLGRVVVFQPEGGRLPQDAYRMGADVTRGLVRSGTLDPATPEAARRYFELLLPLLDTDANRIQASRVRLDYPAVARNFRMIDDDTYSLVITAYGYVQQRREVNQTIDALRAGAPGARELRRKLQPYVVGVRLRQANRLRREGLIDEIRPGYGLWLGGYDAIRGLVLADQEVDVLVF